MSFLKLNRAVRENHLDVVKVLLEYDGIDSSLVDKSSMNVYHEASQSGHLEMIKQLIDMVCDICAMIISTI